VARKAYIARRINPVSNDISQTSHKTVRSALTNININLFTVTTPETDMGNYNVRQMNRLVSTQIESDSSFAEKYYEQLHKLQGLQHCSDKLNDLRNS
jgi:hypothetical protein